MTVAPIRFPRFRQGARQGEALAPEVLPSRHQARRKLYEDIGDFLFAHQLELSERNFGLVRAYLDGDRMIGERIGSLLRDGEPITDALLAELAVREASALSPDKLVEVADQLNGKLVECLRIVGQSSASVRDYGVLVDLEVQHFEADPIGTLERLLMRTRAVVDLTLDLEGQLDKARKETERLRTNLTTARREADHDHLTGLLNRRSFETRLLALPIDADPDRRTCIALCDIDLFKRINDEHGHDTGDRVLRHFGRRLRDALKGEAVVARYGGEEFACLFEGAAADEAVDRIERIRADFETKPLTNRSTGRALPPLTFSAGIANVIGDPHRALIAADAALYDAKRAGRNCLVIAPQ